MSKDRNFVITQYTADVARANGVASASQQFSVDPVKSQVLIDSLQLSSSFLKKIKIAIVINQAGQVLGLDGTLTASTTNTGGGLQRAAKSAGSLVGRAEYMCRQVNFDTAITYTELDQWAHLPNYRALIGSRITSGMSLSLLCIGWNGIKWTATSDVVANPRLQDVQRGWLQNMRETNFSRCMGITKNGNSFGAVPIKVGPAHEYKNIDAVAQDLRTQLGEVHAERTDLVAIVGRDLLNQKQLQIINQAEHKATELNAASVIVYDKLVGGLPALVVPYFPGNTMMVTTLVNLAIYMQKGSHRRTLLDEPKSDQFSDYESMNLDYVIEDKEAAAMAENIELDMTEMVTP